MYFSTIFLVCHIKSCALWSSFDRSSIRFLRKNMDYIYVHVFTTKESIFQRSLFVLIKAALKSSWINFYISNSLSTDISDLYYHKHFYCFGLCVRDIYRYLLFRLRMEFSFKHFLIIKLWQQRAMFIFPGLPYQQE